MGAQSTRPGAVRRMLDVWGFVPALPAPREEVSFRARDGVTLAATYLPARRAAVGGTADTPAVVLAHGFAGHRRKPAYARLAAELAEEQGVLTLDLRGHGASNGRSTLGVHEALDIRAAAAWLRARGHPWVAGVGVSMGGSATLRAAAIGHGQMFDALCTISAPAQWGLTGSPAMRRLTWAVAGPVRRRTTGAWLQVRLAAGGWPRGVRGVDDWAGPVAPRDLVAHTGSVPLLVVHGADDHFYGSEQAAALVARAGSRGVLWEEPVGFGHAEDGLDAAFAARLSQGLAVVRATGAWPDRDARVRAVRVPESRLVGEVRA